MDFDDETHYDGANYSFRTRDEYGNRVTARLSEEVIEEYGRAVCLNVAKALYFHGDFRQEQDYRLVEVRCHHVIAYRQNISFQKRS